MPWTRAALSFLFVFGSFAAVPAIAQDSGSIVVSTTQELKSALTNSSISRIVIEPGEYGPVEIRRSGITLESSHLDQFVSYFNARKHDPAFISTLRDRRSTGFSSFLSDVRSMLPHFSGGVNTVDIRESSDIKIKGLYITGFSLNAIRVSLRENVSVDYSVMGDGQDQGILFHRTKKASVSNSIFFDLTGHKPHAFYFAEGGADDGTAVGNIIVRAAGSAMHFNAESATSNRRSSNLVVAQNQIYDSVMAGDFCGIRDSRIENNVGGGNNRGLIFWVQGQCDTIDNDTVIHNTMNTTGGKPIEIQGGRHTILNNIFVGGTADADPCVNITSRRCNASGAGPFLATQLFIDSLRGNYRLKSGSPAIDRASPSDVRVDADDGIRPFGPAADMGAYEYGGQVIVQPTPIPTLNPNGRSPNRVRTVLPLRLLVSGESMTAVVQMTGLPNAQPVTIQLSPTREWGRHWDEGPAISFPTSVTIPPGQLSASFDITANPVTRRRIAGFIYYVRIGSITSRGSLSIRVVPDQ